jgi:WD40 repeat protein
MKNFKNENLLQLILSNITLYETRSLFHNMKNKTICKTILKLLNYEDIFKSMGKSKFAIIEQCKKETSLAVLPNGKIVSAEHTIRLWDTYNNIVLKTLIVEDEVIFITALPDNTIVICLQNSIVKIWKTEYLIITTKLEEYKTFYDALLLPNGNIACIADNHNYDANILILDSKNNYKCLKALDLNIGDGIGLTASTRYRIKCLLPIVMKILIF